MTRLADVASSIKSANAGASMLTFDISFPSKASLRAVLDAGALSTSAIAARFLVEPSAMRLFVCWPVLAIKVTMPRRTTAGGREETDFDGTQQFVPLLDLNVGPVAACPSRPGAIL